MITSTETYMIKLTYLIITACQRSFGKAMFSYLSVCPSVCLRGSYVTITYDAFDLTGICHSVGGGGVSTSDALWDRSHGRFLPPYPPDIRPGPRTDVQWCPQSGRYAFYSNPVLFNNKFTYSLGFVFPDV